MKNFLTVIFLLAGCSQSTTGVFNSPSSPTLTFREASLILVIGDTYDIANLVSGGIAPYTYSVPGSQGLFAGSIYTAPYVPGVYIITVTDTNTPSPNSVNLSVTVNSALIVQPDIATMNSGSQLQFTAAGGIPPYSYTALSGGGSITADGLYTAQSSGGNVVIQVTDAKGTNVTAAITVQDALSALSIAPPTASLLANSNFTFTASGGLGPYAFSIASGSGSVSTTNGMGLFTAAVTAGTCKVRVTDSVGSTKDATVTVYDGLTILPTTKSLVLNQTFTYTAIGGVLPYSYSVYSGVGTILDAKTGAYSSSTTGSAMVRVTDSAGNTSDATITVNGALAINPASATVAAGGTQSFTTSGGISPYVYTVSSGGGSFTGSTYTAPTIAGGASVVVLVTDSANNTANATITINPITVTITSPIVSNYITADNKAAFPANGTCSELAQSVVVSAADNTSTPVTATVPCSTGIWSTTLNLSGLNDVAVTLTANHANINGVAAVPATVTISKVSTIPTITITSPAANSYVGSSVTVTGTCTKAGPVNISTSNGITATTSCQADSYSSSLDLTTISDGTITITASHTDSVVGNAATPATVNVTKDTIAPSISAFTITNTSPTYTRTYSLTFTATDTPSHYCILENTTTISSCTWTSTPVPSSYYVSATKNAKVLSAWVKDLAGNISSPRADSNSVTLANTTAPATPSSLSLFNPSTSPGILATPTIEVSGVSVGDNVAIYTDSGCTSSSLKGSATVASGTSVAVTSGSLSNGTYTFYAKATNSANIASNCSTANIGYTLSPIVLNIGNYTSPTNATLAITATGSNLMCITNTAGCGGSIGSCGGNSYEAYATSKAWTLTSAGSKVYAKFQDADGNETACIENENTEITCSGAGVTQTQGKCIFTTAGSASFAVAGPASITIKAWGGGGGGGTSHSTTGNNGGGGGYATSTITLSAGTATVLVGGGGTGSNASAVRSTGGVGGGGNAGFINANNKYNAGAGGGRSALISGDTDLLTAGGGGGGAAGFAGVPVFGGGGCGTDGLIGQPGTTGDIAEGGGGGGTSSAGGAGGNGTANGTSGAFSTGGNGGDIAGGTGGGGGGGYYGGGGGGATIYTSGNARGGGGGGGSCKVPVGGSTIGATNSNAANNTDSDYTNNAGAGGAGTTTVGGNGNPGLIIITW